MLLESVRAIVTGAASGLGRYFVRELMRAGASVAVGDTDVQGLEGLRAEVADAPGLLYAAKLDVRQESSVVEFVQAASQELGGVNVLVNNAGILRDGLISQQEDGWVKKLPTLQWKQVLDVNLTGPYLMTREVAADIMTRGIR